MSITGVRAGMNQARLTDRTQSGMNRRFEISHNPLGLFGIPSSTQGSRAATWLYDGIAEILVQNMSRHQWSAGRRPVHTRRVCSPNQLPFDL